MVGWVSESVDGQPLLLFRPSVFLPVWVPGSGHVMFEPKKIGMFRLAFLLFIYKLVFSGFVLSITYRASGAYLCYFNFVFLKK